MLTIVGGQLPAKISNADIKTSELILDVFCFENIIGVDYAEGPPVPIPNTVVKLTRADNSWRATSCKDK